ncbi:sensor histidine kinase [Oharaeibacter diazotrophicus]|uniref:histidine kinase n=2 Tax=Oharaeibacter diazotrophicus TaxID=1920512 RepID=A0A4R6RMT3_9HYPH|nr:sensor histidine kinase [Oharaeibacter diazotrophicus]TDP87357.1 signal transduction histidine kinase [Oharaeibacter diazotrophicus]BBE70699.1 sensor protein QseC [Pleomorphomonas sp. SM30]GLS77447.1 sensor histidine kinase [Oharaeibacter diazotrophicus]
MTGRRQHSIGRRLAVAGGVSVAVFAAVMAAIVLNFAHRASEEAYDRLLLASAQSMADAIRVDGSEITVDVPTSAFAMLAIDKDDRIFHRITEDPGLPITGYPDLAPDFAFAPGETVAFFDTDYAGARVRVAAARRLISAAGEPRRVAVLVAETVESRAALAAEIRAYALAPLAIACLAAIVMIPLSIKLVLRPVGAVERALAARDPSDLGPLATTEVPREIAPLVEALDHFVGRLRDTLERNRVFIADAAHQLRTPLAALRGLAEVAAAESDPAALSDQVERIRRNAVAASRITNQLLADATVSHRLQLGAREPVRLDRAAADAVNDALGFGGGRAIRFDVEDGAAGGLVAGDATALREAVRNLIENAFVHAPGEAAVDVTVAAVADDHLAVRVADRGPGIAAPDRERLFGRFERGAGAAEGGSGLGLAIVARVAAAHGGTARLDGRAGGGLVAEIVLPSAGREEEA